MLDVHAANQRSPRRGKTTYKHAMKLCYTSFSSHRKLGSSQSEEGSGGSECCQFAGIGEIKSESKLILDPNV